MQMINAYRVRGHLIADLDPLGAEPELPSRARPGNVRPHHLGPGPRVPHRQPGRGHRRGRAEAGGHAARDPGDPAPDLLRQDRLRVHEHPGAGAEALAATAHGAAGQQLAAGPRDAPAHPAKASSRPRSSSISCIPASWARSASRWRAARRRWPSWRRSWSAPRGQQRARDRDRHGAPRPAEHSGQRGGQGPPADLLGVRRRDRSRQHAGLRRREVSPGRHRRAPAAERAARSWSRCRPIPATWKPWTRWWKASCGPSRTAWATPGASA